MRDCSAVLAAYLTSLRTQQPHRFLFVSKVAATYQSCSIDRFLPRSFHRVTNESLDLAKRTTEANGIRCSGHETLRVDTFINAVLETSNDAHVGDFIVCGPLSELYVLTPAKVDNHYNLVYNGDCIAALTTKSPKRLAIQVLADDISLLQSRCGSWVDGDTVCFKAPWGSDMLVEPNDYLLFEQDGGDRIEEGTFYRVEAGAFAETYQCCSELQ